MFLIHNESFKSEYVASKPFKVNTRPMQVYVMVRGNKRKYLSELETGDEILAVDKDGESRTVIFGRVKIEKRPFILVESDVMELK